MNGAVKLRRPYRSPRRAVAADATRVAILDAAESSFRQVGIPATTIASVASRAVVSPKTVYAVFGDKRALLAAVLDRAIAGDDRPIPILDRDWVRAMREAATVRERLTILGREGAAILARRAPVDELITRAADVDVGFRHLGDEARRQRRAGQAALLAIAIGRRARPREIDTLFAIGSPEVYRLLVARGDWNHARFEGWYVDTLKRLFLPAD
jgi:AcrR family transcriptional regulator